MTDARVAALPSPRVPADRYVLSFLDYETSMHVGSPHLTRWRSLVRRVVGQGKPTSQRDYALVMAFIFVESGGRQYAISRSGCIGLMQFCDRTALREPFGSIFGAAQLRGCDCAHRRCRVHGATKRFLETTPPGLHAIVASELPCDVLDPRFDPERAIRAGWAYIECLGERFDYNPYLIYIGYNSGPHVAERVWKALGGRRAKNLTAIGGVLRKSLKPNFGRAWARRRAGALLRVHLPKVGRLYRAYLRDRE
ncbi:MAG: transglycosylase SLT domain-containing protein [Deltaproteobacteria bacterium]|nr:transglycosylase SLT domain-containing protein [Deltaproteobacteria bacterium]